MKKSQITFSTHGAARRGFTLVEMLVVAALIAIFAGLAVFNITAQLEREKSKAAIAEARNIATGLSFAYDDLGFFPKLGLLKYNVDNLFEFLKGTAFDSAEYHSYTVGNQDVRLRKNWKQNYMAGAGPDKTVLMHFTSNGKDVDPPMDWPADPWKHPYVGYFLKTIPGTGNASPTQKFIQNAGEKANYAAAIVSYGRNGVPGLGDNPSQPGTRDSWRLYTENPLGPRHFTLCQGDSPGVGIAGGYNQTTQRADAFTKSGAVAGAPDGNTDGSRPYIRERLSDDRYYEF